MTQDHALPPPADPPAPEDAYVVADVTDPADLTARALAHAREARTTTVHHHPLGEPCRPACSTYTPVLEADDPPVVARIERVHGQALEQHDWPTDQGAHVWGPWMAATPRPNPTERRVCVHHACHAVETRKTPNA